MPSTDGQLTLRFLASRADAGPSGAVSGGQVLEWIDGAGYACAALWSGRYCVTAYVGNIRFARPVLVGELVEVRTDLVHTSRSGMHIWVTVRSCDPRQGVYHETTSCLVVFVAVDDDGRPIPVRRWEPRTATQHAAEDDAVRRISVRASIEAAMAKQSYTDAGTAPRTSLRFHVTPNEINAAGKVSGGTVMRWIDETAHLCASTWAQGPTVATYAGGIRFYSRLDLDDVVEVQARLLHTGRSSMHVSVHVRSGSPHSEERRLTTHCLLVFAALGEGGTVPVRRWAPVSAEDIALDAHAVELIALRTAPEFSQ